MAGIVWLASYPSSGSTWLRVLLQNIMQSDGPDANINKLDQTGSLVSRLWLDDQLGLDTSDMSNSELAALRHDIMRLVARGPNLAFVKTHDSRASAGFVAEHSKAVVYIVRNPLDVCHSYAAHMGCDIDSAISCMADNDHVLTERPTLLRPLLRQHLGSWSDHVVGWLDYTACPVLTVRYEDLHIAPRATIASVLAAIGIPASTSVVDNAIQSSSFKRLAQQEAENGFREKPTAAKRFFRLGAAEAWREILTLEQVERVVAEHGPMMLRLGYIDSTGQPLFSTGQ
jgi:aryl sulfotransferase